MKISLPGELVLLAIGLLNCVRLSEQVIVDGSKKKEISATKYQSDEHDSIDSFNTKLCGLSDPNFEEHEFVNMAREGQFPWFVSFQIMIPDNSSLVEKVNSANQTVAETKLYTGNKNMEDLHFCSGSFISDKWILSAAHCFATTAIKNYLQHNKLKVVAGSHKVSSKNSVNRNLTISRIYYHPKFDNKVPIGFDIALVELKEPVKFTQQRRVSEFGQQNRPFMNAICLPKKEHRYKFNETARVAGWGLSSDNDVSSMPSKLLTTDILIANVDDCVKRYSESLKSERPKEQNERYQDLLCAGYKNSRDACQSDSGGPLMQYAGGKAIAIGIVSYGIGCATKGVPGVYTRTSAYTNWIKDITMHGSESSVPFKLLERKEVAGEQPKATPAPTPIPVPAVSTKPSQASGVQKHQTKSPKSTGSPSTTSRGEGFLKTSLTDDSDLNGDFKFFDES